MVARAILLALALGVVQGSDPEGCHQSFELITGFVFRAPNHTLELVPGTLHLTECLSSCRRATACRAVNFETGLCVLFAASAEEMPEALVPSQVPVFTIYARKVCLAGPSPCRREWSYERVPGWELVGRERRSVSGVTTLEACADLCLSERDFECRSATWRRNRAECHLSDADRHSLQEDLRGHFLPADADFLESNCVDLGERLCEFRRLGGRLLKTADAVFQEVSGLEECRRKCLSVDFRCQSFDLGYPKNSVCRLSHLASPALLSAEELYMEVPGTATYEVAACYNVSIQCRSREMVASVRSSRPFNGKVYARARPNSCVTDVLNSLDFEIRMAYHDLNCDVQHTNGGEFANDLVIQHHDMIVTNQDMGVTVRCQYDLANKSVAHGFRFLVNNSVDPSSFSSHSVSVGAPNVSMAVVDRAGRDLAAARVGDPLLLRFSITDPNSPYDMFVRELVAMDGIDSSEILLIDALGCPTDPLIMGPVSRKAAIRQVLEIPFDAFKFPTTEIVQFKALVTPCLPACEPAECVVPLLDGRIQSRGRKRRKRRQAQEEGEEVVVVRAIRITDKFGFERRTDDSVRLEPGGGVDSTCLNVAGLVVASSLFLVAQLVVLLVWACVWHRRTRRKEARSSDRICDTKEGIDNPYHNLPAQPLSRRY